LASENLSDVGQNISKKVKLALRFEIPSSHLIYLQAIVMSLGTIESSFVTHTTKGIQGFNHPEYPAIRVALEVLNATEGYLWVRHLVFLMGGDLMCF
jgi:hypothetical protein